MPEDQTLIHSLDDQPPQKFPKVLVITGIILVVLGILGYLFIAAPAKTLLTSVNQLKASSTQVLSFLKAQDLAGVRTPNSLRMGATFFMAG